MELINAIKYLLVDKNFVVIPGIGGLSIEYEPARINQATHTLTPPSNRLAFNSNMKDPDNQLLKYLTTKGKLNKTDAEKKIKSLVSDISDRLEKGEKFELKEICTFRKDSTGNITITPHLSEQLTSALLGYTSLRARSLTREAPTEKKETVPPPPPSKPPVTNKQGKPAPKEKKSAALPITIIILALLIAGGGVYFYTREDKHAEKNTAEVKAEQPATNKSTTEEKTKEDKYAHCTEFYIVAGSFKEYKNASSLKKELDKRGFNAQIISSNNNYYRVAIKRFEQRDTALKELRKLKKAHGENVWLLSI